MAFLRCLAACTDQTEKRKGSIDREFLTGLKKFCALTVALVGATRTQPFGGRCLQRLLAFGFRDGSFPSIRVTKSFRARVHPSILDVPRPDHVGVVVLPSVFSGLMDCAGGERAARPYTPAVCRSGTEEGRAMQRDLTAFSRNRGCE